MPTGNADNVHYVKLGMLRVLGGVFHDLRGEITRQNSTTSPSSAKVHAVMMEEEVQVPAGPVLKVNSYGRASA